jgi:hypothetical protein
MAGVVITRQKATEARTCQKPSRHPRPFYCHVDVAPGQPRRSRSDWGYIDSYCEPCATIQYSRYRRILSTLDSTKAPSMTCLTPVSARRQAILIKQAARPNVQIGGPLKTKKLAGVAGLLAALALTATGCQVAPNPSGPVATRQEVPLQKVADFDPSGVTTDAAWVAAFGDNPALSSGAARDGLKILAIMYGEYPAYTVQGFVPTEEHFIDVSSKLRPLVNDAAFQHMQSKWAEDKTLPVITSYRSRPNAEGVHGYTYTTERGEKCTDTAEPYGIDMSHAALTAMPDANGIETPVFSATVNLVIDCQEGGKLEGQMQTYYGMKQEGEDGAWIIANEYGSDPGGAFTMAEKF